LVFSYSICPIKRGLSNLALFLFPARGKVIIFITSRYKKGYKMKVKQLLEILQAKGRIPPKMANREINLFQIDSRKVGKGDFFVPLKGERFDGHDFIQDALSKGAVGYFTEKDTPFEGGIKVDNTLEALTTVGKYKRKQLNIAIGITGTAGKTTTKELLSFALKEFFPIYSTSGNYNNEIGVPLTLANIKEGAKVGIFEFGAGKVGDIKHLVKIATPEIRVLTSVGKAHIQKFGSFENIIKGKGEIFEGGEVAVLPYNLKKYYNLDKKIITFGQEKGADILIKKVSIVRDGTKGVISVRGKDYTVKFPAYNHSLIYNTGILFGIADYLDLDLDRVAKILPKFNLPSGRGKVLYTNGLQIVDDTYNANPLSVENSIKTLSQIPSFKILVLGDMLELGDEGEKLHRDIGKLIANSSIDFAIFHGELMKYAYEEAKKGVKSLYIKDKKLIPQEILKYKDKSPTVWIKGSRGLKMEEVIQMIQG